MVVLAVVAILKEREALTMAYEDQNVNSGAAETDNFSQAEVTEAAGEVAAEAYEVENYAREAYEHKSTLDDEKIKKLSKKKIYKQI